MTKDQLLLSFDLLDEQYIEEASPTAVKPRKRRIILTRAAACAVLLAILVPTILLVLPLLQTPTEGPPIVYDPPTIFNALESPELLYGNGNPFVVGNTTELSSGSQDPPYYGFRYRSYYIVHAEIISVLPDIYYCLYEGDDTAPTAYRLIHFRTLEALCGSIPEEFLYLMPARVIDETFDSYDTCILSMALHSTENYILRNKTQNKLQAFPLVLFYSHDWHPERGTVIAFTDGIFNENLFHYYDPDFVELGCTEEYTLMRIKEKRNEIYENGEYYYNDILLYSTDFKTEEARAAFTYVQPFENGVFVQSFIHQDGHPVLVYKRYIGGCATEETIMINLETEEVTYSEVRYSEEELRSIVNISEHITKLKEEYTTQLPMPPHIDPQGKELSALSVFGWYIKIDGNIYGVVKTTWLYHGMRYDDHLNHDLLYKYYDDSYLLFDTKNQTAREVSRDELLELTGGKNFRLYIYTGKYGNSTSVPCE